MCRYTVLLLLIAAPAFAVDASVPLGDCDDWVIVKPGITCTEVVPWPCENAVGEPRAICDQGNGTQSDNEGWLMAWQRRLPSPCVGCPCGGTLFRIAIVRYNPATFTEETIAYVDERCDEIMGVGNVRRRVFPNGLTFDEERGELFFAFVSGCEGGCPFPLDRARLLRFEQFTTTFEVLQSYVPTANTFGFHVPFWPEGFQAASFFDSYYGDLSTVGDWSQAQPLQCGYPATAPDVGDYLTVADTVPTPAPGQGYYVITAANYMGQRRYGRKNMGGTLTGRDPAVLPVCQ